jgi:hypothetical protein
MAGMNQKLIDQVDGVIEMIALIERKTSLHSIEDVVAELKRLRKQLSTSPINDAGVEKGLSATLQMPKCWRDAATLYIWGQGQALAGASYYEIHDWLKKQNLPYPGNCNGCKLTNRAENLGKYVRRALKIKGMSHRLRKAQKSAQKAHIRV